MEQTTKLKPIQPKPFLMQPVEIIIPFHGETSRVSKLIDSIFKTIHSNRYLITLVDDGSENKHFVKQIEKAKVPGLRCIRQEHKGFGAAVNFALTNPFKTRNLNSIPWVCIMHSDVYVDNTVWLSKLGETLFNLSPEGVKMVSSVTNNPTVDSVHLRASKGEKKENHILSEGYLPMYCALAHRELFSRVGPFKEYPYAGLETENYAIRMAKMGYKQGVCGASWVHHEGGATLKNFTENEKVQEILRNAKEEFDKNKVGAVNITK